MYRDDDTARAERAVALIDEIAELERQKVLHAATDRRLEAVRRELSALQSPARAGSPPPHGLLTHLVVFSAAAVAAFLAYALVSGFVR